MGDRCSPGTSPSWFHITCARKCTLELSQMSGFSSCQVPGEDGGPRGWHRSPGGPGLAKEPHLPLPPEEQVPANMAPTLGYSAAQSHPEKEAKRQTHFLTLLKSPCLPMKPPSLSQPPWSQPFHSFITRPRPLSPGGNRSIYFVSTAGPQQVSSLPAPSPAASAADTAPAPALHALDQHLELR